MYTCVCGTAPWYVVALISNINQVYTHYNNTDRCTCRPTCKWTAIPLYGQLYGVHVHIYHNMAEAIGLLNVDYHNK